MRNVHWGRAGLLVLSAGGQDSSGHLLGCLKAYSLSWGPVQ